MKELSMLIIEDMEINRSILSNIFKQEYNILEAANGQLAWEMLSAGIKIDIILLDIIMPVMNGIEFLKLLRNDERFCKIPVVVSSQQNESLDELNALELGADDFIVRPYNIKILKRRVRNLTEKYVLEKRQMEYLLHDTEEKLISLVNTVPGGIAIFTCDEILNCTYFNHGLCQMLGYEFEEMKKMQGHDFINMIVQEDLTTLKRACREMKETDEAVQITIQLIRKNSEIIWAGVTLKRMRSKKNIERYYAVFMNLTCEKIAEQRLKQSYTNMKLRAERDPLTGIYNKNTFYKKTREMLDADPGKRYVIALWNIDRFKVVNDLFGSRTGDMILKNVAESFSEHIHGHGTYGRMEADNFAICCSEEYMEEINPFISEVLRRGVQGDVINYPVMIHIGFYEVEDTNIAIDLMCDRASLALHTVKSSAVKRWEYYKESMREVLLDEQWVVNEMEEALKQRQFFLQFQPIVDSHSRICISAEALIRWRHPEKGVISPGLFIPLFEKNGFISKLDMYVFEETCRVLAENRSRGLKNVPVSVNLSRMDFYHPELCENLVKITRRYQLPTSLLKLEVTESAYTDNPEQLIMVIDKLHEAGFRVLMDDFGSGYSSLNMLKDVPVDILKIDMKFVHNLETSERGCNILYNVINMAHDLKMETVAEGVETENQYETLKNLGCDCIQGYYFSKPLSEDSFELELMEEKHRTKEQKEEKPGILIVDDIKSIRIMMKLNLEENYRVFEAANGLEALEILKKEFAHINLVLSDIMMPEMDGLELLTQIMSHPLFSKIPVIVVTAYGEPINAIKALELGALDIIQKPIEPNILLRRIANILKVSGSTQMDTIHTIRESNLLRQSARQVFDGRIIGLLKLRKNLRTSEKKVIFVNDKFLSMHEIDRSEEKELEKTERFSSNIEEKDRLRMIRLMDKALRNRENTVQTQYSIRINEENIHTILMTASMEYYGDFFEIEIAECELLISEKTAEEE